MRVDVERRRDAAPGGARWPALAIRRGSRLAIDEKVARISTPTGETNFALSEVARQAGSGRLVWRDLVVSHARLHTDLEVWIYRR